jgi:hypothetical protein
MTRIEELNKLPEQLKREVLDYAEYLLGKYHADQKTQGEKKWADVRGRGRFSGETAGETVIRMRGEERW